jgi:GR25 family glycosyltransferase involved in LPS biosynthesis
MAVAQSHLNAWKRVANDGVTTLVVEDDAQFLHDFESRLARICAELPDIGASEPTFDLLYLSYRSAESGMERITYSESLFRPIRGLWWLSGYVLTPRGATKLLDALPIKGPVDQWMNHQFGRLDVYASSTPLIVQRRQWRSDNAYSIIPVLRSLRARRRRAALRRQRSPRRPGSLPPRRPADHQIDVEFLCSLSV